MSAGRQQPRDLFPVYLVLALAVCVAGTVVLLRVGHPGLAAVTAATSVIVALTLGGWLVAGPYLEACLVVDLRKHGGQMPRHRLFAPVSEVDERILEHLARKGVVTVADDTISLHEAKIGRVLTFFIRLRNAK